MTSRKSSLRQRSRLTALGAFALLAACSDVTTPSTESELPPATVPAVSARIDGAEWKANFQVNLAVGDLYATEQRIDIVGLYIGPNNVGRQLTIQVRGYTGPGTYTIGPASAGGTYAFLIDSPDVMASRGQRQKHDITYSSTRSDAGTVTIASYDAASRWATGTFTVEVTRTGDPTRVVRITNGTFAGKIAPGTKAP